MDTPSAIKSKIKSFEKSCCSDAVVTEYNFKNQLVYLFYSGCNNPDEQSDILNSAGETICALGGLTGNVTCDGVDFSKTATNERQVWHK